VQLPIKDMFTFEDYEDLVGMEQYSEVARPPAPTHSPFASNPLDEDAVRVVLGYGAEEEFDEKDDDLNEYSLKLAI